MREQVHAQRAGGGARGEHGLVAELEPHAVALGLDPRRPAAGAEQPRHRRVVALRDAADVEHVRRAVRPGVRAVGAELERCGRPGRPAARGARRARRSAPTAGSTSPARNASWRDGDDRVVRRPGARRSSSRPPDRRASSVSEATTPSVSWMNWSSADPVHKRTPKSTDTQLPRCAPFVLRCSQDRHSVVPGMVTKRLQSGSILQRHEEQPCGPALPLDGVAGVQARRPARARPAGVRHAARGGLRPGQAPRHGLRDDHRSRHDRRGAGDRGPPRRVRVRGADRALPRRAAGRARALLRDHAGRPRLAAGARRRRRGRRGLPARATRSRARWRTRSTPSRRR